MSHSDSQRILAMALRAAATRSTELLGGGCALVFAAVPGDDHDDAATRLRAAAGFASAEAAKTAAAAVAKAVEEAISSCTASVGEGLPELGRRGSAQLRVYPLIHDDRVRGAFVAAAPAAPSAEAIEDIETHIELAALKLDHAHICAELDALRARGFEDARDEPGSDELLKLSEALFTQDLELMRSNEKLGKIERLKNDFIEKMSRELRTPLNSIIEAIIGVLAGEHEQISDHAKSSMRTALDEGTAFQRTLQNILDLWRMKQGELPIELQEVNVSEVVEEAIFSVQDSLEPTVRIEKQLDPGLPKIRTDLAKINQLFFLLLDNAVKFTPSGTIRIAAHLEGDQLVCEVSDTGIGVCADDQEFIYDEFFQVDAHSSTTYRGAGLGLSLVRDLIVLLDGQIGLESEAGKGTTIRFAIPVEPL